ncbi:MAG TPA: hypothetical protein VKT77_04220 [Chthonomonadaceae bacterium]|nr:hypothetical protein [Chthonomonadaceae bacterium]
MAARSALDDPATDLIRSLPLAATRRIVALAGLPGSGKSTLAARLADEVNARTAPGTMVALGMDGFHLTRAELDAMPDPALAHARRGAPWTFAPDRLRERLAALRSTAGREAVAWPDFQHDVGDPVEGGCIVPSEARIVLVEGIYLLHDGDGWQGIPDQFDERWYLDTPLETSMARVAARHVAKMGLSPEAAAARANANDRLNAEVVARSRFRADFIVRP